MSEQPIISVVMPVYNAEKYLKESVESILTQTFRNFDLIVVNDGSSDRSEAILKALQNQDNRIQIISRPNTGIVGALNDGLRCARGRYIARMDADDIALPERFAKQVDFLDNHPDYVAVGSRTLMIDPDGLPIRFHNVLTSHEAIDAAYMAGEFGTITHPAAMIRRNALERIGGYRREMMLAEDDDLFMRLGEIGKLANLPDVLLHYRQHSQSFSTTKVAKGLAVAMTALNEARLRRGLELPKQLTPDIEVRDVVETVQPASGTDTPNPQNSEQDSTSHIHQQWAWWALGNGNRLTARKHAFLALKSAPTSKAAWKTLACAIRGW